MSTDPERKRKREYMRQWREGNTERARQLSTESSRRRRAADPESARKYQRDYQRARRQEVVAILGGQCAQCGNLEERPGFLDIDHMKGDAVFDADKGRLMTHEYVLRALKISLLKTVRQSYQLLCPNCHRNKTLDDLVG